MLSTIYIHNSQSILLMTGANAGSSKRTNIRIFVRLEKVRSLHRIFVSTLPKISGGQEN